MTNLWAFLLQTLYVAGVGLLLLAIKTLLKDKLSPRWQYAVWAVLALRILLPAYTGKYYVLLPLPLWVETAKVMVEPHWASAYTNVYEATQVTSPIPWLTGAPVSLSDEPADGANRPGGGHGSAGAMERAFCGDCDPGDCRGTGWYFNQRGAGLDTECPFQVAVSSGRKRIEKQDARRVMVHSSRPVLYVEEGRFTSKSFPIRP